MEGYTDIRTDADVLGLLDAALKHEWAVSFEYVIHAYSMPKARYVYQDPISGRPTDARGQTIQIGIDEMYHSLQIGLVIARMGGTPTFRTDEVLRFPRIVDNLRRDRRTEDLVTDLYQAARFAQGLRPEIENMLWTMAADEIRHGRQFAAMIDALESGGHAEARIFSPDPAVEARPEVGLLHEICRLENELMHRDLKHVLLFSEHQDLGARLFKNSVDHMRHWDKAAGLLVKMGTVIRIENAERGPDGVERSARPQPVDYPGDDRPSALEGLLDAERELVTAYETLIGMLAAGDIRDQLQLHLALTREHVFTHERLLENAHRIFAAGRV